LTYFILVDNVLSNVCHSEYSKNVTLWLELMQACFLPARRYDSAVFAVERCLSVCPSDVCLSVTHRYWV